MSQKSPHQKGHLSFPRTTTYIWRPLLPFSSPNLSWRNSSLPVFHTCLLLPHIPLSLSPSYMLGTHAWLAFLRPLYQVFVELLPRSALPPPRHTWGGNGKQSREGKERKKEREEKVFSLPLYLYVLWHFLLEFLFSMLYCMECVKEFFNLIQIQRVLWNLSYMVAFCFFN